MPVRYPQGVGHDFCNQRILAPSTSGAPFSRAEARAAGITLRELLSPRFHKIFYDCYIASTIPITVELRAQAALAISPPHSHASHFTAAEVWGGVVPENAFVHVSVPGVVGRSRRQGIKAHGSISDVSTRGSAGFR